MEMKKVYEIDTWRGNKELNEIAIAAAKKHSGKKYTVSIGEWGVKTFLVFAESKEEAKALVKSECDEAGTVRVRDVTNCKKYQ